MTGFLDDEGELLAADLNFGVAAPLPFAAALPELNIERARLRHAELPLSPVVRVHPVAETVFVRRGFVAHHDTVRCRVTRQQCDDA